MHDLDRDMFERERDDEYGGGPDREQLVGFLSGLSGGELASEADLEGETQELELATALLEVSTEAELDRFIGNVFRRVAGAAGDFARSDTGRQLGGIVKAAVGKSLPVIGRAVGQAISPSGGDLGGRVGSAAGALLGLELEALSAEDRELEVARALVRFAQEACRRALAAPPYTPAPTVARVAATGAAQEHAPGLLPALMRLRRPTGRTGSPPRSGSTSGASGMPGTAPKSPAAGQTGRWLRDAQGRIVLLGV